jgi:hypothetical protein
MFISTPASRNSLRHVVGAALIGLGSLVAGNAAAAIAPLSIEGPIQSIVLNSSTSATMVCDGVTIQINASTVLTSPLHKLTIDMMTSTDAFQAAGYSQLTGQKQQGFVGGTCIMDGMRDDATGLTIATLMNVSLGETVLVGNVSDAPRKNGKPLAIAGVKIVPIDDARLNAVEPATGLWTDANGTQNLAPYFETVHNNYGFGVDPNSVGFLRNNVTTPDLVSAAGYLGTDGKLYALEIATTNPSNVLDKTPRATITDGDVQDTFVAANDRVVSRGGCLLPTGKTSAVVTLAGEVGGGVWQTFGQAVCTVILADAPFGRWKLDVPRTTFVGNHVPYRLRITMAGTPTPLYDFIVPQQRVVAVIIP